MATAGVVLMAWSPVAVSATVDPGAGEPSARVAEAPDEASAVSAAVRQKSPVTVGSLTTETRTVSAQPDGTLRAVLNSRPARVRRGDRWVGADATLERRADGSIGPRAAGVDLAFSGGGDKTPLVSYGKDGKLIELTWQGTLPVPVLEGPAATYAEVLPGVDLVLRAEADGYTQHLVVKNDDAAKHLKKVELGLSAKGVTVHLKDGGVLEARDAAGTVWFQAPPSRMWDAGTKSAQVGVHIKGGTLTLIPDQDLLTGADTKFPVTVDPNWNTPGKTGWAKVFSGKPTTTAWFGGQDGPEGKSGKCYVASGECNGIGVARTYYQWDTGFLGGKQILEAMVNTPVVHSPSCSTEADKHRLMLADGPIGPGTNWSNAPWGREVELPKGAPTVHSGCPGFKGLGFNVVNALRPGGVSTYFIAAVDEGNDLGWRRFDANATNLTVKFNTAPDAPYNMGTDPPLQPPCKWCGGKSYVGDEWIRLQTNLSDPDQDQVHPIWEIAGEHRDNGPTQVSGGSFSTNVDLRGRDKQTVSWKAQAHDGWLAGPWRDGTSFVVDQVGVGTKPNVSAKLYKEDNFWHGGVGVPDEFTFDAAGIGDVDHYYYGWSSSPSTKVDAGSLGGPATVKLAPPGDGPRDLFVQSADRADHRSPTRVYHFYVRAGNGPFTQWAFEGNASDTAFLGERDGTLNGDASYAPGAVGTGLKLAGNGSVTAPNSVRTDASFSVSAWVKLEDRSIARAVVSQDGPSFPGFDLWYRPEDGGKWAFGMTTAGTNAEGPELAWSSKVAQDGVWTHLAGVYDAQAKTLKLYVNGDLNSTVTRTAAPWQSTGPVRIGQTQWNGKIVDNWTGLIDEVQVHDRVLTASEIKAAVSRDNIQVGHWTFEDDVTSKTAANAVAGGEMAILSDGAALAEEADGNGYLSLDGSKGYATTGKPAFRTDQSFSVTALVKLSDKSVTQAVVSQDGTKFPGFALWYRADKGTWVFGMATAAENAQGADMAVSSESPGDSKGWTHVAGVYDAQAKTLKVYVDGRQRGVVRQTATPWNATGPLQIGRTLWNGNPDADHWKGGIDEVRAYSRVLSDEEIRGIVSQAGVSAARYRFDGDAADSSGNGAHGTLSGATDWSLDWVGGQTTNPDPSDMAVHLNGQDAYVSAPHAVDTSKSFSAAAWVRLEKVGGHYGVVSQDGATTSAFKIEADPGGGWSFTMFTKDVDGGGEDHRAIGGKAQVGVWTHVAGVYDSGNGKLLLYVNGELAAGTAHTNAWNNATGKLMVGRNMWQRQGIDYFPGAIDDVSVYGRALFADEVRQMAGRDLTLVHDWALDEPSGTTAADSIGTQRGTLAGNAAWTAGRAGNAIELDGDGDAVSTGDVNLNTGTSFTVSAWMYLPEEKKSCDLNRYTECRMDAVSLDGSATSKFRLGHVVDNDQNRYGAWTFEMAETDSDNPLVTKAAVSAHSSEFDEGWVHLVGVYDAPTRTTWLYVNGGYSGDGTMNGSWDASGGVQIGRGKVAGKYAEYWSGKVDDVRLYTGVLDRERVSSLYHSYPAELGPDTLPQADAGEWRFDEASGTTAADTTINARNLTLKGATGWVGGRTGYAAWLDGTSGYAQTAGPVLTTTGSFSVTAWAYLSKTGTARTVLAQDGNSVSPFGLAYNPSDNRWSASWAKEDKDNAAITLLNSTEAPAVGSWTHLGVVYNASLRQLRLYVNGILSSVRVGVTIKDAPGPFTVGRSLWNKQPIGYFPGGVDDVRAYGRALSDGEVRRIHDDGGAPVMSAWRFDDGTGKDATARGDDAVPEGAISFVPGVSGKAIEVDGMTGKAIAARPAVDTRDSFTVSAWARLSRLDQTGTVAGQDGARMSGFALQYRYPLKRWVFGAPVADSDGAEMVYVPSQKEPKAGEWTHLTGVYDYAARQLRLYVDGELAGYKNNVALWPASVKFAIGRGKVNGGNDLFFPGAIDEVVTNQGAVPEKEIARRAAWPKAPETQLGGFVNTAGDHYSGDTTVAARKGYHFASTLGTLVPSQRTNTRTLYACDAGGDAFTSTDAACEGKTALGEIGAVYTTPPSNEATIPIYRCDTAKDSFDSRDARCGGAATGTLLGHTLAYAPLARYNYHTVLPDHSAVVDGPPPGYEAEGTLGLLALTPEAGTRPLTGCQAGVEQFVSLDPACEGQTVTGVLGHIWTAAPEGRQSHLLYRCRAGGDHFVSPLETCEGQTVEGALGYALVAAPDIEPVFP
ncbi:LamG domain-containing protein [Nonomuraea sp. CA-141351]|uniref:LamG domain-containing protein n=1 Tax=Nonomuraea sp. CA-141351 TaxID=3239996 RepID=UPI003D8C3077